MLKINKPNKQNKNKQLFCKKMKKKNSHLLNQNVKNRHLLQKLILLQTLNHESKLNVLENTNPMDPNNY